MAIFEEAKWIWAEGNERPDDWVLFRREFALESKPVKAEFYIAAETKYWLIVNGKLAVLDGGLFRESLRGGGWYDLIDLAPYLKKGKNVLAFAVWFYGNGGRNNKTCPEGGLLYECPALGLASGADTLALREKAFYAPGVPEPSFLYGGWNIGYDANNSAGPFWNADCKTGDFTPARLYGGYPSQPWGEYLPRPVPLMRFGQVQRVKFTRTGTRCTVTLPYAMQFTPYLSVKAEGGEVIGIRSDRYEVNGGPGDETDAYRGHRAEYRCRPGVQEFESPDWLAGEAIEFTVPESVKILSLGYRESGYDCDFVSGLRCGVEVADRAVAKAARTLKLCMRDNLMDCPDRERGQWIGDVSVQAPQIFYLLDGRAAPLLKKAIFDFIRLRRKDVLMGNVPGEHATELPAQSLNAIGELGMISTYYHFTQDAAVLDIAFDPSVAYLKLWEMGEDGLVKPRTGDWRWFDHLYNNDEPVMENAWYYSALKFTRFAGGVLGRHEHDAFLNERMERIYSAYDKTFWRGDRYASGGVTDDRANALAVLSGLAPKERYPAVRRILISVFNATTYMENYVLSALCEMGYKADAFRRMCARYYNLAMNESGTLWEDFYILGTKNHAWSGAPATILYRYFLGLDSRDGFQTYSIHPDIAPLTHMDCYFYAGGERIEVSVNRDNSYTVK